MKWIGWIMAMLCAAAMAVLWQLNANELSEAEAKAEESLERLRTEADAKVTAAAKGLDERRKSLEKLHEETTQLREQRDALEARKQELIQKIKALAEETERLRTSREAMQGSSTENREELRELQERIGQADRRIALWDKMIDMVRLPGETR